MAASVDVDAVEAARQAWKTALYAFADHRAACCDTAYHACDEGARLDGAERDAWEAYHDARYPTEGAAR